MEIGEFDDVTPFRRPSALMPWAKFTWELLSADRGEETVSKSGVELAPVSIRWRAGLVDIDLQRTAQQLLEDSRKQC
jgi:hypothetical protein